MPRHDERGAQTKRVGRYIPVAERGELSDTPTPAEGVQSTWNKAKPSGQPNRRKTPEPLNPDQPVQTAMFDEVHAQVNKKGTKNPKKGDWGPDGRPDYKAGDTLGYIPSQEAGLREPNGPRRLHGASHLQPSEDDVGALRDKWAITPEARLYTTDMSYNMGGSTFGERMKPRTEHFEDGHKRPDVAHQPTLF